MCGENKASFKWTNNENSEPYLFGPSNRQHQLTLQKPRNQRTQQAINNMLIPLRKAKTYQQFQNEQYRLYTLADETDLFNPNQVTTFILTLTKLNPKNRQRTNEPLSNGYKKCLLQTYYTFCSCNQIPFDRPKLRATFPVPIIPTREQIQKIVSMATWKYATIFTIMAETAIEPQELTNIPHSHINLDKGEISVMGTKHHANGNYILKPKTAEMLRQYLQRRNPNKPPFPISKSIQLSWQRCRRSAVKKYCDPELRKVPLKNLRNFAGAEYYYGAGNKDMVAVQRFMRHYRISTTQQYLQNLKIRTEDDDQYITRTVQLGQQDTKQQIQDLLDNGFTYILTADNHAYFRKRKQLQIT